MKKVNNPIPGFNIGDEVEIINDGFRINCGSEKISDGQILTIKSFDYADTGLNGEPLYDYYITFTNGGRGAFRPGDIIPTNKYFKLKTSMKKPIVKGSVHLKTAFAKEVQAQTAVKLFEKDSDQFGLNSDEYSILFHGDASVLGWITNNTIDTETNSIVYNLPQDWNKALQAVKDFYSNRIFIGGYMAEVVGKNKIQFGCQTITRSEIEAMIHMVSYPISMKATIGDTQIDLALLEKLTALMDKHNQ